MTPLPAVQNVLQVTFKFSYGQDLDVITRFHVQYAAATIIQGDINAYAQDQATNASATWASSMHPLVTLTLVTAVDLNSPTGLVGNSTTTVPGTRTGAELPASTCVLTNSHVARRYRGGKPRNYLPWGIATDLVDPQHWNPTAISGFQGGVNSLVTRLQNPHGSLAGLALVNVSYYQGSTGKVVGDDPKYQHGITIPTKRPVPQVDPIGLVLVNPRPGTQRRRLLFSS